ncbi:MAG: PDZ domain-containing protein [Planctomycetota bacterium]|nr:MAG: PDZ domain-containing protein [Planctomycetota bacterium]
MSPRRRYYDCRGGLRTPPLFKMLCCAIALSGASFVSVTASDDPVSAVALREQQLVFRAAMSRIAPAIVRIDTIGGALPVVQRGDSDSGHAAPGFRQADGPTTGVVWSSDGLIVTSSFNFVREPSVIMVTTADDRRHVARLVARDYVARLAVLRIDARDLPAPRWLPLDQVRVGQWALAAGFGHGSAQPAMSVGIISAVGRVNALAVQTDARISPANYGGPLFDIEGRSVGVCVPLAATEDQSAGVEWYDSGIGFAIPFDVLRERIERLARGEDLRRGYLGVALETTEPVVGEAPADSQPAQPAAGVRIVDDPVGPAAAAGLQKGDVITAIHGVATPSLVALRRQLARHAAGDAVEVSYVRDGEAANAAIVLASSEDLVEPQEDEPQAPDTQPAP